MEQKKSLLMYQLTEIMASPLKLNVGMVFIEKDMTVFNKLEKRVKSRFTSKGLVFLHPTA